MGEKCTDDRSAKTQLKSRIHDKDLTKLTEAGCKGCIVSSAQHDMIYF